MANNGFKPFEMLFKASRCDELDLVKAFAGEFNTKLRGMVRSFKCTDTYMNCVINLCLNQLFSSLAAPQHL